jgi:predicted adenylyl cyclase CyaB
MVTEIELKAHVRDSEALKKTLSGKAELEGAFEKRDVYWFGSEASDLTVTKLRVRKEKRSFADGTEKSLCLVTYKAKEEYHGIEINEELEFEVEPAEAFEEFLKKAGLKPGAGKIKRGWVFVKERITAELVEVDSLGWFIELEILVSAKDKSEETISKTRETLLAFLDDLGIEREAIESRFYLDLLSSKYR